MSLHLLQHRHLTLEEGEFPSYPADVIIKLALGPEDLFGAEGADPRTTFPIGESISLRFNANIGISKTISDNLIEALDLSLDLGKFHLRVEENCINIRFKASSSKEAMEVLASANHCIPAYLSLNLGAYIWIKSYLVKIGGSEFSYLLKEAHNSFIATNKIQISRKASNAFEDWLEMKGKYDRVLISCLYFRHAHRLYKTQPNNHTFIAEILLNLTKSLEMIFSDNRDHIRKKAREWGFDDKLVEERIIPLFLIRNEIDVAHVATGFLENDEKNLLLKFMEEALESTAKVLKQLIELIKTDKIELDNVSVNIRKGKRQLLDNISKYLIPIE